MILLLVKVASVFVFWHFLFIFLCIAYARLIGSEEYCGTWQFIATKWLINGGHLGEWGTVKVGTYLIGEKGELIRMQNGVAMKGSGKTFALLNGSLPRAKFPQRK